MKRFIYLLVFLVTFSSCKKENTEYHKISYELEFFKSDIAPAKFFDVQVSPSKEQFYTNNIGNTISQRIDYWGLKKGDRVYFSVNSNGAYWFIMRVYIDDEIVSTRETKLINEASMGVEYYESWGLNEYERHFPTIEFTYN